MYVPKHFSVEDRETVLRFLRSEPFGVLVSNEGGIPVATHVPFVVLQAEPQLVLGAHVARANPQWRAIDRANVLAIFQGAHAHISAAWYERPEDTVPTWNYGAVHCSGRARLASAEQTHAILQQLVDEHEGAAGWRMETAVPEYLARVQQAIVGIEIIVERIDAQFKYSQNRTAEDRTRVIEHLSASDSANARQLAADMIERGKRIAEGH